MAGFGCPPRVNANRPSPRARPVRSGRPSPAGAFRGTPPASAPEPVRTIREPHWSSSNCRRADREQKHRIVALIRVSRTEAGAGLETHLVGTRRFSSSCQLRMYGYRRRDGRLDQRVYKKAVRSGRHRILLPWVGRRICEGLHLKERLRWSHLKRRLEVYANHRPSGDKCPSPSTNSLCVTTVAGRSPPRGNIPILFVVTSRKIMARPSEDQSVGAKKSGDFKSSRSSPTPSTCFTNRLAGPFRVLRNTIRPPSGAQTGMLLPTPAVNRDRIPVLASMSQILVACVLGSRSRPPAFSRPEPAPLCYKLPPRREPLTCDRSDQSM